MSNFHSQGKRQREMNQAKKKQEKAQERADKRSRAPKEIPIASAEDMFGNLPSIEEAMQAIENPGQVQRAAAGIPARLFVGNLSSDTTEADLRRVFGEFGLIADAVVMTDRGTGAPRGFGFVTMANRKDAPRAMKELDGSELKGSNIVVNAATERGR
jgi:RNA recognition motif-containing protein